MLFHEIYLAFNKKKIDDLDTLNGLIRSIVNQDITDAIFCKICLVLHKFNLHKAIHGLTKDLIFRHNFLQQHFRCNTKFNYLDHLSNKIKSELQNGR